MAGAVPFRVLSTSDFIKRFGHLAQTSQFRAVLQVGTLPFTTTYDPAGGRFYDDLSFLCNAASLPGSSFSTTENLQDYYGINQKYAYRRDFDTLTLDFYVDAKYQTLKFFELWMDYIASPGDYSVVTTQIRPQKSLSIDSNIQRNREDISAELIFINLIRITEALRTTSFIHLSTLFQVVLLLFLSRMMVVMF